MALPLGMRGLAISEAVSLYGGLAVFGGFVLYELSGSGMFVVCCCLPDSLSVHKRFCKMPVWPNKVS